MRLLLDTHIFLWAAGDQRRLKSKARSLIEDTGNVLFFSVASLWELAIKASGSRRGFRVDVASLRRQLIDNGYFELPISGAHALGVLDLPPLHNDPFDRMLIAQARVEGLTLLTADRQMAKYGEPVLRA